MADITSDEHDSDQQLTNDQANEPDTSAAAGNEPDGYYDEDAGSDEEIDLSFLDDKAPEDKKQ